MNQKTIFEEINHAYCHHGIKDFSGKLSKLFPLIKQLKAMPGYCVTVSGGVGNVTLVNSLPEINEANYKSKYLFEQHEKKPT